LETPAFAPELRDADRRVLRAGIKRWLLDLEGRAGRRVVLHGAPHSLNIVSSAGQPRFIDFETVCLGPIEWDLAHLDDAVSHVYPQLVDQEALRVARLLASAKTATWCWAADTGNDEMRWHADHHLSIVKNAGH
jgi:hypothetical protein